jgi:hypothetical protein
MAEDIAAKQAKMAEQTMAKAQEQHQAHFYQQALAKAASRAAPEQQQQKEMEH